MKKLIIILFITLLVICVGGSFYLLTANNFKRQGGFEISRNDSPIQIHRDEHGIAYVVAQSKADVYRGQGFVMAQDRLFQVEFYRALIKGEASAIVGTSMLDSDIKMRVLNLMGNADRNYNFLDKTTKEVLDWYCEGFNEYLQVAEDEFPLELSLLGIDPKPLTPEEIVAVTHFVGLFHSQNMDDEILSLNLAAQTEFAAQLLPVSINLDRTKPLPVEVDSTTLSYSNTIQNALKKINQPLFDLPKLGSNNWAVSGEKTASGKALLTNDPHVDSRMLPGLFYPVGLICPEFKAVGIATPGVPGLLSGRNEFVAFGVTNAYGDSQDLFIEDAEGDTYLRNGNKTAFDIRSETIKVKDSSDVNIEIRSTYNGPVISDFPVFNILTDDVVSLRWSLAETESHSIGFERLLESKNVFEFKNVLKGMDNTFFNYAIADVEGNIAHQATGLIPIRAKGTGRVPSKSNQGNTWLGFIPKDSLPNMTNPKRHWIGTANHDTRPDDYPFYYSNHFSPVYRYQRMTELLSDQSSINSEKAWDLLFDVKNMQAEVMTPIFIDALEQEETTKDIANLLSKWDYHENVESIGASVYNVLYNELLYLVMNDELPENVQDHYWENVYYWNQRVDEFILNNHEFIDNKTTAKTETRKELIIEAGQKTKQLLTERLGKNSADWTWGKLHTIRFASPIRTEGIGSGLLDAETFPKAGSNQTLNRGAFVKNTEREFNTSWFPSFRMVADLNDNEKMIGILSGGSASRIFHDYHDSQLQKWHDGEWIPYWISKEKINEHTEFKLILE